MGCGTSTLHAEYASRNRHAMAPPVKEANDNEESYGERLKEKSVVERNDMKVEVRACEIGGKEKHSSGDKKHCEKNNVEEEFEDPDDNLIGGPGSPSFREYCNESSGDRSSVEYSHDCDSMESIKNGEASSIRNKESFDSNKQEPGKKERRGMGFMNVMNKGKARGRKNLRNLACYSGGNEPHDKGSSNKIVAKTA